MGYALKAALTLDAVACFVQPTAKSSTLGVSRKGNNMPEYLFLMGLDELFVLTCGIGAFRKNGKSQMSFLGAAILSFGCLLISIGVNLVRYTEKVEALFIGVLVTIFGGLVFMMGAWITFLFFDDNKNA